MRPNSIKLFERLVLLSIVLGIVNAILTQQQVSDMMAAQGGAVSTNTVYIIQAVLIVLYLVLIWFISRHGSPVAKWIYVVLAVLGLISGLMGIGQMFDMGTVPAILAVVQYVLTAVTLWLLFRPDSKAWFSEGRGDSDTGSTA